MANQNDATSGSNAKLSIQNNPCSFCRAMQLPPPCKGHGGGGGGGDDSDEPDNQDLNAVVNQTQKQTSPTLADKDLQTVDNSLWIQTELLSNKTVEYRAGLFSIHSNRLSGNLVFKMLPGLSKDQKEDAKNLLQAVKKEFDGFKKQLGMQGVSVSNFKADLQDSQLSIHIPIPNLYDAFIQRLVSKNLLPLPSREWHAEQQEQKENSKHTTPSPFGNISKGPRPPGWFSS